MREMLELTSVLERATGAIVPRYFQLSIDDGDPVYRERVYCYELYHQMRRLWPANCEFYLNGEVDKSAHPILRRLGVNAVKPDLLVHTPGHMSGNHAVIEVKSPLAEDQGIRADINKLNTFVRTVGYRRALYLIFGYDCAGIVERINTLANEVPCVAPIELWLHQNPNEPARKVGSLGSLDSIGT